MREDRIKKERRHFCYWTHKRRKVLDKRLLTIFLLGILCRNRGSVSSNALVWKIDQYPWKKYLFFIFFSLPAYSYFEYWMCFRWEPGPRFVPVSTGFSDKSWPTEIMENESLSERIIKIIYNYRICTEQIRHILLWQKL